MSLSLFPCIGNLRRFIDFSFYGERDIMEKILKWMDSRRKSGKAGGGRHALGMTAPKNPFSFRLSRTSGPILE